MKPKRHAKILELISETAINTQEELLSLLRDAGYDVTQATVSRDIKELRLIKTLTEDGKYRYTIGVQEENNSFSGKFYSIFRDSVLRIDSVDHFVVLKCYVGMAQAACAALDAMKWNGLVGTIAGDDTIFVLMRSSAYATEMVEELKRMIQK